MNLSNRQRIVLTIGLPIVFIFTVIFAVSFYQLYHAASVATAQKTEELADQYAALLNINLREAALVANLAKVDAENQQILTRDKISTILRSNIHNNALIFGSAMAFAPYQYEKEVKLYAPYVYRQNKDLIELDIAKVAYDYTSGEWEWWEKPRTTLQPLWGSAYLGKSVGVLMVTYAVPLIKNEKLWGVVTVDISLNQLHDLVQNKIKKEMNFFIINSKGQYVYHPDVALVKNQAIFGSEEIKDSPEAAGVVNLVASGQAGLLKISKWGDQKNVWIYYHPLDVTGWFFIVILSQHDVLQSLNAIFINSVLIALAGLFGVLVFLWILADFASRRLQIAENGSTSFIKNIVKMCAPFAVIAGLAGGLYCWAQTPAGLEYTLLRFVRDIPVAAFITLLMMSIIMLLLYAAMKSAYAQLTAEKDFSHSLLLHIFPRSLVNKIRKHVKITPEAFPNVSILYAEVTNFSLLTATLKPQEAVDLLNALYNEFDKLTEKYAVEKIKTLGAVYIVASGMPAPCKDHAPRLGALALEMLERVKHINARHRVALTVRIGIHSGGAVGGVIGSTKISYDLLGDTVPIANRLASCADNGKIHVSQDVWEQLKFDYNLLSCGVVPVEGYAGEIYYLTGKLREI